MTSGRVATQLWIWAPAGAKEGDKLAVQVYSVSGTMCEPLWVEAHDSSHTPSQHGGGVSTVFRGCIHCLSVEADSHSACSTLPRALAVPKLAVS